MLAVFLGVISPNIRTRSVRTPVTIPVALLPHTLIVNDVANAEQLILTMLLPIRTAESIFAGWSIILITRAALLLPSSTKDSTLILFTVINEVSADEKNADKTNKITIAISWMILSVSKKNPSSHIRKMVKSLIAGYVITLLMLVLLTYFMRKFILDEKAVDNIIFGIYVAGSFTGAMLSAWMIKKRRVVTGIIYGAVYITVLLVIATIMKKQAPDSSNNIAMSVAACVAAGAFGGFFSP